MLRIGQKRMDRFFFSFAVLVMFLYLLVHADGIKLIFITGALPHALFKANKYIVRRLNYLLYLILVSLWVGGMFKKM